MDRKTLLALVAVLLLLGGAAALTVTRARRASAERLLWSGDPDKVVKVSFTSASGLIEMVKSEDRWQLVVPLPFPADEAAVKNFFEKLPKATLSGPLTESKERQALFGLDAATAVRLQAAGGTPLDVLAGKASPDSDGVYVKLAGSEAVYEARGLSRSDVDKSSSDWISKAISAAPPEALDRLVLKGTATVALAKTGADWKLEGKAVTVSTLAGSAFNRIQGALASLEADGLQLPPLPALAGKPTLQIMLRWNEKGAVREEHFTAYPEKGGLVPLVKKGEERVRFLVYPWRLETFRTAAMELH